MSKKMPDRSGEGHEVVRLLRKKIVKFAFQAETS